MKNIGDVLENVKSSGAYQVMCYYGSDSVGCDDMDVAPNDRNVRIIWYPVGCLGEVRCMWNGKISDALDTDFHTAVPTKVSNPPKDEEVKGNGYWAWGAGLIDDFMKRFQ